MIIEISNYPEKYQVAGIVENSYFTSYDGELTGI
jgi:hypothetical protein